MSILLKVFSVFIFTFSYNSVLATEGEGATCGAGASVPRVQPSCNLSETQSQAIDTDAGAHQVVQQCLASYTSCMGGENAGGAVTADQGNKTSEAVANTGGQNIADSTGGLMNVAKMASAAALSHCQSQATLCNTKMTEYQTKLQALATAVQPPKSKQDTAKIAMACEASLQPQANAVFAAVSPCTSGMAAKIQQNGGSYAFSAMGANEAFSVGNFLSENGGAIAGMAVMGGMMSMMGGDSGGGGGGGSGGDGSFSVSTDPEGGQCLTYGGGQEKCYTNTQLANMCFKDSSSSSSGGGYGGYGAQQQSTQRMTDALCKAFTADTREGAGGDEETCHPQKEEYYKDEACKARMIAQCQSSEFGDCAKFNSHHCHKSGETTGEGEGEGEEEVATAAEGEGSNYCTYRLAKQYCESGGGNMADPACAWVNQVANTQTGSSSSCLTNIEQTPCYPKAYPNEGSLSQACQTRGIAGKDPVCMSMGNSKMNFSWRYPGHSGGTSTAANGETGSGDGTVNTAATGDTCEQPAMDCATPGNRDKPACIQYYCCFSKNSAAPICQSLGTASVSPVSTSGGLATASANRYPAGSLPSDINPVRNESLFSSNSSSSFINQLCSQGQLYDCGALQGYTPPK